VFRFDAATGGLVSLGTQPANTLGTAGTITGLAFAPARPASLGGSPWGAPVLDDEPVPSDYDGDDRMDLAVYRRSTGEWLIRRSTDAGLTLVAWGAPVLGDVPVPGDYDADGATDVAVYRTTTGEWFVRRSSDGALTLVPWGAPALGDVPVPARY
jgi:hypothetical protein